MPEGEGIDPTSPVDAGAIAQVLDLLEKGGPIVAVLILLSIIAVGIILLKLLQYSNARLGRRAFVDAAVKDILAGKADKAEKALQRQRGPIAAMMAAGLAVRDSGTAAVDEEMARVGANELGSLQSFFRWLEVIGNISPLLGLLGTVLGMITAFQQLELAGNNVDPAVLSGGIWEALLTTAVGLTVAIPAVTALNLFEGRVERTRLAMQDAATRLSGALNGAAR